MSFRRFLGPLFSWGNKSTAPRTPFTWEKFREKYLTTRKIIGVIALSYGAFVIYYLKNTPWAEYQMSGTRLMSRMAGRASRVTIPTFMRSTLFGAYAKVYNVKLDETVKNIDEYASFAEFFTREIKPRPIQRDPNHLVSPADSKILVFSEVDKDQTMLIKGQTYKMGELLTGITGYEIKDEQIQKELKKNKLGDVKTKLFQCILYLAPGDYHRFHSPADFLAKKRNHIHGYLLPVKVSVIEKTPTVYATNERVGIFGEWPYGFMAMVFVGALNVGSVTLNFDKDLKTNLAFRTRPEGPSVFDYSSSKTVGLYDQTSSGTEKITKVEQASIPGGIEIKKGDEIGRFNLGSTIVLVFEAPENFTWNIKPGDAVRYGETIGVIPPKEATPSS